MRSRESGLSLPEVMVAAVILAVLVPLLFQTFTGAIHIQTRRAVQEEALIFASDYLEYSKLQILNPQAETDPFDTIRPFRSDTLILRRTVNGEPENGLVEEHFSVSVDSRPIIELTHTVPDQLRGNQWR